MIWRYCIIKIFWDSQSVENSKSERAEFVVSCHTRICWISLWSKWPLHFLNWSKFLLCSCIVDLLNNTAIRWMTCGTSSRLGHINSSYSEIQTKRVRQNRRIITAMFDLSFLALCMGPVFVWMLGFAVALRQRLLCVCLDAWGGIWPNGQRTGWIKGAWTAAEVIFW